MYFFTNSSMHRIIYNALIGISSDVRRHHDRTRPIGN